MSTYILKLRQIRLPTLALPASARARFNLVMTFLMWSAFFLAPILYNLSID